VASVIKVNGKYRCQVRYKGVVKCKTFPVKAQATRWGVETEDEIDAGLLKPETPKHTVADVIRAYRAMRETARPIADTSNEHYQLRKLSEALGHHVVADMTPDDLVAFASARREEDGAGPYTVNMDISKLGTVLRFGGAALKVAFPDIVGAARPTLSYLRLIGGGGQRERRPLGDELQRILDHLEATHGAVYAHAAAFAASSAMRRGEVCSIGFEDVQEATQTVQVWRKHPRKGKVLETVPVIGEAWRILQARPRGEPEPVQVQTDRGMVVQMKTRVFPIHPSTLSKYFTWACRALGIPDLHLHDLRHEGTSALFESGMDIPEAALVTGHKDWRHLKRYTNLRPEDLAATLRERRSHPDAEQRPGSRQSASPGRRTSAPDTSPR
jgi:integrase